MHLNSSGSQARPGGWAPPAGSHYFCLVRAAKILLGWKARFKYDDPFRDVFDRGSGAWVGNQPCTKKWYGVGCSTVLGRRRVTSL